MSALILTHADTDGLCSGALALSIFRDAEVLFTNPVEIVEDIRNARGHDRVIVCDVAIDISAAPGMKRRIDRIAAEKDVVYIDHHPLPPGFSAPWLVHRLDACGALLAYDYYRDALDPDMSRVAMYGAIGDFRDTTPLAAVIADRWDKRSLYYEAGTLSQGIEIDRRNRDYKRLIVRQLAANKLPSQIEGLAEKAVRASRLEEGLRERVERTVRQMRHLAYVIDPDGFISKAAIYARIYGSRPVGVCAEYRDNKQAYDLSARAEAGVDLNVLLNLAATRFGGHGGGHAAAGGGRIPAKRLEEFLAYLDILLGDALEEKGKKVLA
jgi:single-stranded-DNA-specific exonuclease